MAVLFSSQKQDLGLSVSLQEGAAARMAPIIWGLIRRCHLDDDSIEIECLSCAGFDQCLISGLDPMNPSTDSFVRRLFRLTNPLHPWADAQATKTAA